jgi:hypothetical protein
MSTKRARYDGPATTTVFWPPGETRPSQQQKWTVEPGHWLPDDAPAKLRDELLQSDDWTEIEQSSAPAKKKED